MPNRRGLLYLILSVISGVCAVLLARTWLASQVPERAAMIDTTPVVVAATHAPAGSVLVESRVEVVDWPTAYLPEGVIDDPSRVRDRVLRRAILEGEPLLESALLPEGAEAGLHSLIRRDRRAMSVEVDAVIGVAGWVKPGTRVDVLATVRRVDWERPVPYSQVILQDVLVLAIDQKLEQADAGEAEIVSVVTLEVTPDQAQRLAYVAAEGTLQLALRNPEDSDLVPTRSVAVADLVHVGEETPAQPPEPEGGGERIRVETVRGAALSEELL